MERSVAYSLLNFPIIFGQCTANISSVSVLQIYLRSVYCKYISGQCTANISSVSVLQIYLRSVYCKISSVSVLQEYLRSVYCKYIFGPCTANISSVSVLQIYLRYTDRRLLKNWKKRKNCIRSRIVFMLLSPHCFLVQYEQLLSEK